MNFIAIDFETAKYSQESACSIGLVKYQDGKELDSYYSLIRPPILYIRPDFTAIHGLTVENVKDAPTFPEIWESAILPFIGETIVAAHNAHFDMNVLRSVLKWYGIAKPALTHFCTLQLARHTWPELQSHALTALAQNFSIIYNAHNALDDARTCGAIANRAAKKYGSSSIADLLLNAKVSPQVL
ncbi:3'-5' exonuclease [Breznakiellaceae bacterium SP9]